MPVFLMRLKLSASRSKALLRGFTPWWWGVVGWGSSRGQPAGPGWTPGAPKLEGDGRRGKCPAQLRRRPAAVLEPQSGCEVPASCPSALGPLLPQASAHGVHSPVWVLYLLKEGIFHGY